MPDKNKTLYEVLGVKPDAKMTDIGRAYNRIRADLEKEHAAPNPRFAALAKVAYETLSDPQRREAYDESLREPVKVRSKRGLFALVAGVAVLVAAAVGANLFMKPRGPAAPVEKVVTSEELVENVGNRVGRLRSALMSGECTTSARR
jgi:DnaJ-class molecular chaperone with C-terminal Zn finger domain